MRGFTSVLRLEGKTMRYLILILFILAIQCLIADPRFHATQSGNIIQLSSPYGSKIYMGDLGFDRMPSYRFEVLLKDLKPPSFSGGEGGQDGSSASEKKASLTEDEDKLIYEANRLYNLGKFHDSMSFVQELLNRNPKNIRGWIMKGSLYHVLKQKELAKNAWAEALKLDPENQQVKSVLENYQ